MLIADELCDQVAFLNEGRIVAMDAPRNLKLQYGQRAIRVEYGAQGQVEARVFFLDQAEDHRAFLELMQNDTVQTIHSQEASLEQIFIKLTGRGLI